MYQIENLDEPLRKISGLGPERNLNILLLGEDGVGKEYYAREIHKLRKHKDRFLLVDFEVERWSQKEQIEFLVTGGPGCFVNKSKTNTFFLRRIDFLDRHLILQLQNFFRETSSILLNRTSHFMKLGILSSANIQGPREVSEALNNLLDEFFALEVHIPPLRERKPEFGDLIRKMASMSHANCVQRILQVFIDYEKVLTSYHWPGNLDELQSWIERICCGRDMEDICSKTLFQQKSIDKVNPIISNISGDSEENSRRSKACPNLIAYCSFFR